jgi:hypothetical protein
MHGDTPPLPQYVFMTWCSVKKNTVTALPLTSIYVYTCVCVYGCVVYQIYLCHSTLKWLGIFIFTTASRTALGPTQPPIRWVPEALSLGVKRPGREADHSPPSSAEAKE